VDVSRPLRSDVQKKTAHASEQDRPDVKARREAWFESQLDLDVSAVTAPPSNE